jgi:hypothetical protein
MNAHSIFKSKKTGSVAVIAALFSAIFLLTNSVSASPSSEPASFVAVSPYRLIDTRPGKVGNGFGGGSPYVFTVTGSGGVPYSGVTAVSLNVTVTGTEAPDYGGYVTVYPCDSPPNASSLNFTNGQTVANAVISPVNDYGQVCFYVFGRAQLIVDVNGYYQVASSGTDFYTIDTGEMYVARGGYSSMTLYCPSGTVAISANSDIYGLISSVSIYDYSALIFLTNDTTIDVATLSGQLTCATYSYSGQSFSAKGFKANGVEASALSDESAAAEDLAKLTAQAIQAGLVPSEQISK